MSDAPTPPRVDTLGRGGRFLRGAAFAVIVIGGLKLAGSLLVPILVAAFIAVLCAPFVDRLAKRGVPSGLAVVIVLVVVVAVLVLLTIAVVDQLTELSGNMDTYRGTVQSYVDDLLAWLKEQGVELAPDDPEKQESPIDAAGVLGVAKSVAGTAANALSTMFLVLLTVVFMLTEASGLRGKIRRALGDPEADLSQFEQVAGQVWAYLGIKTALSLVTGVLWAVFLMILGVEYALLWGLLAFLLNYIPNIGSLLAAIPAVLLALLTHGLSTAVIAVVGNLVINNVIGNVVEPRVMGSRLGLSPLVVFLSLIFWSWMWGPVGMLLSVPLTMVVKILLENTEDLRAIAILLGPSGDARASRVTPDEAS